MDAITTQRLSLVHPKLRLITTEVIAELAAQGVDVRVTQGLRTVEQQDALYAQGRTAPGHIVTNARGGYSAHNFGIAVDCVPGVVGKKPWGPDWDVAHYSKMQDSCRFKGLVCGCDWKGDLGDEDHFQLAGYPVTPDDAMREVLAKYGMQAVWNMMFCMKTSDAGIKFIEKNEGLRLVVYLDAGKPCIGYGHDLLPDEVYPNGITMATAQLLLDKDLGQWENAVNACNLPLTQSQFDVLVDFTHNLGVGALHQLLSHGLDQVPTQLERWDHVGGAENAGLLFRRKAEAAMWQEKAL
jgi:peptidoglycan L-alanyl-D-glutamate endopeptidase CwlK